MGTMQDAIDNGQGIERPFNCEAHDDRSASASVNVLKMLWYCHACMNSGSVDGKKAPSIESLLAMSRPEKVGRIYPPAFLELYDPVGDDDCYWHARFPAWLVHALRLGQDPFTGAATFPVYTHAGALAGVGKRAMGTKEELKAADIARYRYPHAWAASQSLFGTAGRYRAEEVVVLVEGAADAAAVQEVGALGLATYGAGLHVPQRDLLARFAPKLVLLGFDMDTAGEEAVTKAFRQIGSLAPLKRVKWPANDPADCSPDQRMEAITTAVRAARYGGEVSPHWRSRVASREIAYDRYLEESA